MSTQDNPENSVAMSGGPKDINKIFVGGLSWNTTQVPECLREYFSTFGHVTDVMIMRDKVTGRSRGFAFINFETIDDVDSALSKTTHVIDGRQVEAKRAVPKSEIQARTKKIFVGGVPQAVSDDAFKSHFAKFGEIAESQIMKDRTTGKSRGFGFVTYVSEDSVDRVFQSGAFEIGGKKVEVKKAEPKRPPPVPVVAQPYAVYYPYPFSVPYAIPLPGVAGEAPPPLTAGAGAAAGYIAGGPGAPTAVYYGGYIPPPVEALGGEPQSTPHSPRYGLGPRVILPGAIRPRMRPVGTPSSPRGGENGSSQNRGGSGRAVEQEPQQFYDEHDDPIDHSKAGGYPEPSYYYAPNPYRHTI